MPTLIMKRKSGVSDQFDIPIGDERWGPVITLFRNQTEKIVFIDEDRLSRAKAKLEALAAKNVIQYLIRKDDEPRDKRIVGGLVPEAPTTASITSAFRLNITSGSALLHDKAANLSPTADLDCVANGFDKDGTVITTIAADGDSRKAHIFLVNTEFDGSGSWTYKLIYGDEDADANIGTVEDLTKGYLTQAQLDSVLDAKDWELYLEIGKTKFARSGGSITQTYLYEGEALAQTESNFTQRLTKSFGFADFSGDATTTKDIDIAAELPSGIILMGCGVELDEAFTTTGGVTALTCSVGISGDKDELMADTELLSGPPTVGRLDADPTVGTIVGAFRNKYAGLVNFTATGGNLDTLDAGSVHIHIYYLRAELETQPV